MARLSRLAHLLAGFIAAVVLFEGLGRLIHYLPSPPGAAYLRLTNAVGPLPEPSSRSLYESADGFRQWLEFNWLGFRTPLLDFPSGDHAQRILVLGDSYSAAWQVPIEQRWTEQMQELRADRVVLNLGVPNWGTDQEYLTLLNYPLGRAPDLVLLLFFAGNDVSDNARQTLTGLAANHPYFVPAGEAVNGVQPLREIPWQYANRFDRPGTLPFPSNLREWLHLHSVTYRAAGDLWRGLRERNQPGATSPSPPSGQPVAPIEAHVFDVQETPEWTTAWKITEALLLKMSAAAGQRGSRFALVLAPNYAIVQPELTPGYITANPSGYDLRRPATRLTDFAKTHDILLLDLTPGFVQYRQADPERPDLFFRMDKHFTPFGNCLAAVLITNWLDPATEADTRGCR